MADLPEVDNVKLFFTVLLAGMLAAVLIYVWNAVVTPLLQRTGVTA